MIKIHKFNVKIAKVTEADERRYTFFKDLDYDGNSEEIWIDHKGITHSPVLVNQFGKTIDQWNFIGSPHRADVFFSDIDNDSLLEIIVFTKLADSLYLNVFNPLTSKVYCENVVVTPLKKSFDEVDYSVENPNTFDTNNDNIKELYFYVNSGFSAFPRQLFCFDFTSKITSVSPNACANLSSFEYLDLNDDGKTEIYPSRCHAVGNCPADTAFSDSFSWLMAFNPDLSFLFPPIKMGHYPATLRTKAIKIDDQFHFLTLYKHDGNKTDEYNFFELFDLKGESLIHKPFHKPLDLSTYINIIASTNHKRAYTIFNDTLHEIVCSKNRIDVKAVKSFPTNKVREHHTLDIDGDGMPEHIFSSKFGDELVIATADFENVSRVSLLDNDFFKYPSIIQKKGNRNQLYFFGNHKSYFIEYFENPIYLLKFAYYPAVYLIVFAIIWMLSKFQEQRLKQKGLKEKRISELQLKSAINQMEPHFTLNIVESLNSLFDKQDKKRAVHAFSHFSRMLRNTLINSDKIGITLNTELEHVENYLELMKFRHNQQFDYSITIHDKANLETIIPKMLVHTFVENAIKHGFRQLDKQGRIDIEVNRVSNGIQISITDNGVGRKKAANSGSNSTGKGLKIIDEINAYFKKEKGLAISYEIVDLKNEKGMADGTQVVITIPIY